MNETSSTNEFFPSPQDEDCIRFLNNHWVMWTTFNEGKRQRSTRRVLSDEICNRMKKLYSKVGVLFRSFWNTARTTDLISLTVRRDPITSTLSDEISTIEIHVKVDYRYGTEISGGNWKVYAYDDLARALHRTAEQANRFLISGAVIKPENNSIYLNFPMDDERNKSLECRIAQDISALTTQSEAKVEAEKFYSFTPNVRSRWINTPDMTIWEVRSFSDP